jgi:heparosan-N-sulfate-glucuronate 5-epimerase
MFVASRLRYYSRIFAAYAMPVKSHLTFWHETPEVNTQARVDDLGEYYMLFAEKADYSGHYDDAGIPLLNYHGRIGRQYNPIAIAQWGLGNYNLFRRSGDDARKSRFLAASDWLCTHLEQNSHRIWVWNHHFDWEYRTPLKAPWYSALAQGQGISLLVRAHRETARAEYLQAANFAFTSFLNATDDGGVTCTDEQGNIWFEEYTVSPPTHILNGFMWAAWGVYDYFLATRSATAKNLFEKAIQTLRSNLDRYDLGFWSLYEQSRTVMPMVASTFYHRLHIVQLRIMHRLTGEPVFAKVADKWEAYGRSRTKRTRALCCKTAFKLCYY